MNFRSHGLGARLWELALFGYFDERDFDLDMTYDAPDFLVGRGGLTVAVEATMTNRARNEAGSLPRATREEFPHIPEDVADSEAELIFQSAKALRGKTRPRGASGRRYWDTDPVKGGPFVVAVEAFHGDTSLFNGDSGLASYLYGRKWTSTRSADGSLIVDSEPIHEHTYGGKTIDSGLFFQPEMENLSAVLFSNAATITQFPRLGIEYGMGDEGVVVVRASRVPTGAVGRNVEVDDDETGTIASGDLNPAKSRVLLKLALLKTTDAQLIQSYFELY